ncbi:MAG: hypothetical protein MH252_06880 [Thermosynechococcaceae cyanobacterium MS004]|nr:hypothetical protein [Thermosynechococcaceae cyanobacterium MS004]
MSKTSVYKARVPFFQPMEEIFSSDPNKWKIFQDHYGKDVKKEDIIDKVYGGLSLKQLFSHFEIESNDSDLQELRATIRLIPADASLKPVIINRLSLKQFLVAGLPAKDLLPWDGKDNWDKLDSQYRLELCHSEVSRWSIFIKRDGKLFSDADLENHEPFSDIELVNNCTTVDGFEFRVKRDGSTYHGSFGSKVEGRKELLDLYQRLSQWQAGSLAKQNLDLIDGGASLDFFDYYKEPIPIDSADKLKPEFKFDISLEKYRPSAIGETSYSIQVNRGDIDYKRWGGESSEYFQKPQKRRLVIKIKNKDGKSSYDAPKQYEEIATAQEIILPNFQNTGIYDISDPQVKIYYRWLYEFDLCLVRSLSDNRAEIELRRAGTEGKYELRRFIFGNIDLNKIPAYLDGFWTLHRFGYGARDTSMNYDADFTPPSKTPQVSHYAYQLGGEGDSTTSFNYICPEGFGVERAIFAWEDSSKRRLVIDLISFERILPVWQGIIDFSQTISQVE